MRQFKVTQTLTDRSEKSVEKYFNDVNKRETITAEEEVELAKRIAQGDEKAFEKLVSANLKFVISVAKKYQSSGMPLSDLINEGNIGLVKAARKFDETKGFKFISFAVWWIRQTILQSIADNKRLIKVPSNKNMAGGRYVKAVSDLTQQLEREPTHEEIAEFMETDTELIDILNDITKNHKSLDSKVSSSDESSTLIDLMEDEMFERPEDSLLDESLKDDIERAFNILSKNEKYVIKKLYGIGCNPRSKEEIAKDMDFSPERIRQLGKSAERKMANNKSIRNLLIKYM
jgi:RNA polymerase primary sigma factor